MDRLWAPWRLSYIEGGGSGTESGTSAPPLPTGCIFCDKPREANRERENFILARGTACFVILNAFPYSNGHLMVVPFRHLSTPVDLTAEENAELMTTASWWAGILKQVYRCDGYNIGMNVGSAAGAGIAAHLHLHVVPRWSGDTNFMPVLGGVKVMPETLDQTYEKLARAAETYLQPTKGGK